MWKGKAAILKPKPASTARSPNTSSGGWPSRARATPGNAVVAAVPYTNDSP